MTLGAFVVLLLVFVNGHMQEVVVDCRDRWAVMGIEEDAKTNPKVFGFSYYHPDKFWPHPFLGAPIRGWRKA